MSRIGPLESTWCKDVPRDVSPSVEVIFGTLGGVGIVVDAEPLGVANDTGRYAAGDPHTITSAPVHDPYLPPSFPRR